MNTDEKYIFLKLSHFDDNDNNGPWYIKGFNKNNDFSGNTGIGNLLFQIASCLSLLGIIIPFYMFLILILGVT